MKTLALVFIVEILTSSRSSPWHSTLEVNGKVVEALWVDGDTVRLRLNDEELRYRLLNVNALESDSSKHTIGQLSPAKLAELSAAATALARSQPWKCHVFRGRDAYGRGLILCPDLAVAGLRNGVYMPYDFRCLGLFVGGTRALTSAVEEAKAKGAGIWEGKNWPNYFATSVHVNPENGARTLVAVDAKTGCVRKLLAVIEEDGQDGRACIPNSPAASCMKR